jgi:hypothetical protein
MLGGCQLGQCRTTYLHQPGARYILSSTIPRYGYSRRPMSSCTVLDPLGAQAVRRPGHLLGRGGEDVLGESTRYIFKFICFLYCSAILILSYTQDHFCLVEGVSKEMANIVFSKAAQKVIKNAVKHACLISTSLYYSQVLYHSL